MFKKILLVLLLAVLGIIGFAATRPDALRVERSVVIQAPAAQIFAYIEDFHAWTTWSPYEGRDAAMKRGYAGAPRGKGAIYTWEGNSDVGSGSMEITQVTPPDKVVIALKFTAPMEAENVAEFTLVQQADGVKVTWVMTGTNSLIGKVFGLFMNMDELIGGDFAKGLGNLKALAEKGPPATAASAAAAPASAPPSAAASAPASAEGAPAAAPASGDTPAAPASGEAAPASAPASAPPAP